MMIRKAELHDVSEIVRVHQEAFPNFFLTQLGARVLRRYYSEAIQWRNAYSVVATDGEEILGFAVGIVNLGEYNEHLIRHHSLRLAIAALPRFILHPSLLVRALWSVTRPKAEEEKPQEASITSIAVSSRRQRRGLGKLLLAELVQRMQERGVEQITLSTDMENNERANAFYASSGFHLHHSYTTWKGRRMNEYALRSKEQEITNNAR